MDLISHLFDRFLFFFNKYPFLFIVAIVVSVISRRRLKNASQSQIEKAQRDFWDMMLFHWIFFRDDD